MVTPKVFLYLLCKGYITPTIEKQWIWKKYDAFVFSMHSSVFPFDFTANFVGSVFLNGQSHS